MIRQSENKPHKVKPKLLRAWLKKRGFLCYGFLEDDGVFDRSKFSYGDYSYVLPSRFDDDKKGTFLNLREKADWISVATFKDREAGRTEENISHVLCAFLDLDGANLNGIVNRCLLLGLLLPKIILTSDGHYHLKWYFKFPVPISKKSFILKVQRALHEAFKDLGSDPQVYGDLTRFLRNENQINPVNKKYPHKPRIEVLGSGSLTSLGHIYRVLKANQFIASERKPKDKPEVRGKVVRWLKAHPRIEITFDELALELSCSARQVKRICEALRQEGKLITKVVGRWSERKTQFITNFFKVTHKDVLLSSQSTRGLRNLFLGVVEKVKRVGFPENRRNKGCFMMSQGLKSVGFGENEIRAMLKPAFLLSEHRGRHRFSEAEFERTVNSPFKRGYDRGVPLKEPKWDWEGFVNALWEMESGVFKVT